HVTDHGNASRTMLLDLRSLEWSAELLDLFGVSARILPRLCPSSAVIGPTEPSVLGAPVPIAGIAGDQQAALFGQGALARGDSKNTYGTGCFLLMNVGPEPASAEQGLLSTVAWTLGSDPSQVAYALEGSVFMAGGAVQWLQNATGIIEAPADIGPLAARAQDNGGVYFVPALTGLGTPYWDPYARGLLIGLTRGTTREHIARATEEAICFQTRAVLDAICRVSGIEATSLQVDGGAADDDFLLQLQADILGIPVVRPHNRETTALGAAALAGLAIGFWSRDDITGLAGTDRSFAPDMTAGERKRLHQEWERAVARASGWAYQHEAPAVGNPSGPHAFSPPPQYNRATPSPPRGLGSSDGGSEDDDAEGHESAV
ncbi:MAG: FGGY-family carbohydrate kinase, partial [bacterium]